METKAKANTSRNEAPPGRAEELPYQIELWRDEGGEDIERILARAFNAQLARAIFKAAASEHPDRRITLRKGERIIADSSG